MGRKITLLAGITLTGLAGFSLVGCSDDGGTKPGTQAAAPLVAAGTPGTGVANNQDTTGGVNNQDTTGGVNNQDTTGGTMAQASTTMGQVSTSLPPEGGAIPIGTGFAITPDGGYVSGNTNGLGIQGAFYAIADSDNNAAGTSTIAPATFAAEVGVSSICVSGTAAAVAADPADPAVFLYGDYWGTAVGFNLANPGDALGGPGPWDRGGITGFSYNLSGATVPADMRLNITFEGDGGTTYCAPLAGSVGPKTTLFSDVGAECWNAGGAAITAGAGLIALQWAVVTNTTAPVPFDFCIENLTAIQ